MTNRYREIPLDAAAAVRYIRETLELGHTLSRRIGERNLEAGRILTRLPADADTSELTAFEWGQKLKPVPGGARLTTTKDGRLVEMTPVPDSDEDVVLLVRDYLQRTPHGAFVIEHWLSRSEDPRVSRLSGRVLTLGREVYTLICPDDRQWVEMAIRDAKEPRVFVAVLARAGLPQCAARTAGTVTDEELARCASAADMVIIGAYDGEAYLFWTP